MTIADIQRGDGLQPGKTLPWAKDHGLGLGWVQLKPVVEEPERQRRDTLWESLHLRRNRVELNIVRVLMKPDSVGLHDPRDGGYEGRDEDRSDRGRFPEERQNRSSRHPTWDPRWPHSTICQWSTIESKPTPAHTLRNRSLVERNSLSVSIVSNAAEIFSHLLTWLLTTLPGYLPIKLSRSYLIMWQLTCLIVLSEFGPWLNLADPTNVVLVCGSIPMALCKTVSRTLPTYLLACRLFDTFLLIYLHKCLPASIYFCVHVYWPTFINTYWPSYPATCLPTHLPTCLPTWLSISTVYNPATNLHKQPLARLPNRSC